MAIRWRLVQQFLTTCVLCLCSCHDSFAVLTDIALIMPDGSTVNASFYTMHCGTSIARATALLDDLSGINFSDDSVVAAALLSVAQNAWASSVACNNTGAFEVYLQCKGHIYASGFVNKGSYQVTNYVNSVAQERLRQEARRQQQELDAIKAERSRLAAEQLLQQKREFTKKNKIYGWVTPGQLSEDGSSYRGQQVGTYGRFSKMVSKDEALFISLDGYFGFTVVGFPARLGSRGQPMAIAGKCLGEGLVLTEEFSRSRKYRLSYSDSRPCTTDNCSDMGR